MKHVRRPLLTSLALAGLVVALSTPVVAATVNGTDRADVLRGTDRGDLIRAFDGDDVVIAGGGNDDVRTGPGADIVRLGAGADHALNPPAARGGSDTVHGGPGPDVVIDAYAADLGDGDDRYLATQRSCLAIDLGPGDDTAPGWHGPGDYYGGRDDCVMRGGPGEDFLAWSGYDGPEGPRQTTLLGGGDADTLMGGYNEDVLIGGPGPDTIHAVEDYWGLSDVVVAGPGADEIFTDWSGGGGPIDCGDGNDTVHGVAPSRVLVSCEVVTP